MKNMKNKIKVNHKIKFYVSWFSLPAYLFCLLRSLIFDIYLKQTGSQTDATLISEFVPESVIAVWFHPLSNTHNTFVNLLTVHLFDWVQISRSKCGKTLNLVCRDSQRIHFFCTLLKALSWIFMGKWFDSCEILPCAWQTLLLWLTFISEQSVKYLFSSLPDVCLSYLLLSIMISPLLISLWVKCLSISPDIPVTLLWLVDLIWTKDTRQGREDKVQALTLWLVRTVELREVVCKRCSVFADHLDVVSKRRFGLKHKYKGRCFGGVAEACWPEVVTRFQVEMIESAETSSLRAPLHASYSVEWFLSLAFKFWPGVI